MKRREFVIKAATAGAFVYSSTIFPFINTKKTLVGNALRFPQVLQTGENLTLQTSNVEVWPGTTTQVIALNNSYPNPTIKVKKGDNFSVIFDNQHSEEATIHWHGLLVPEIMDGHPKDAVLPGQSYTYTFPITQRAGTYFYHSHAHHLTAKHVYKGFAGFFIIEDDSELSLGLPSGEFDVPLLIQDRRSVDIPQFNYQPNMMDVMNGYLGDITLVNGTPDAYLEVQKTLYRFRIVNGSNARVYKLAFSDNSLFWILSTDAGLKDEVIQVNNVFLAPGERLEILYDFSNYSIGNAVNLITQSFSGGGNQGIQMNILRFDISGNRTSDGVVPQNLLPINYYNVEDSLRTREFTLSQSMMGTGMHRINNLTFDMARIDEIVNKNELEEWKFINTTNNYHPMHIHGVMFQVYSRNGNTNLPAKDKGWKDTVLVFPNESVSVLIKFVDYTGIYLLHCHNLEHETDGMMLNLRIDSSTDIQENNQPKDFILYQNYPNPFNPSTTIEFMLNESQNIELSIYDILGNKIETLLSGFLSSGLHKINYVNKINSSGIYFYNLKVGNKSVKKKMTLLK